MNPQAAVNMVQEIKIFHEEYKDRPQLMVVILAGFTLLIAAVSLSVVVVGSLTLLLGCAGMLEEKPALPAERHKIRVLR